MITLINKYIEAHKLSWAESTLKSEKARLNALKDLLQPSSIQEDPNALWQALKDRKMSAYTRVITWTRVSHFYYWCLSEGYLKGSNVYADFRKKNARLFKYTYKRQLPNISFSEARVKILQINNKSIREKALEFLSTGMRWNEQFSYQNGEVIGKGSKIRKIFLPKKSIGKCERSYSTFRRELQKINLKPHMLRKICLSRLVELGASPFELCEIAGWSNLNTASSYIKVSEIKLKNLMGKLNA